LSTENTPPDQEDRDLDVGLALTPAVSPLPPVIDAALTELQKQADLLSVPNAQLLEADAALLHRLSYVSSLLRINQFLRQPPTDFRESEAQALAALRYLRHSETTARDWMALGKHTQDDDKLRGAIQEMRSDINKLADLKAARRAKAPAAP